MQSEKCVKLLGVNIDNKLNFEDQRFVQESVSTNECTFYTSKLSTSQGKSDFSAKFY